MYVVFTKTYFKGITFQFFPLFSENTKKTGKHDKYRNSDITKTGTQCFVGAEGRQTTRYCSTRKKEEECPSSIYF
jgi:hypothetical protein